MVLLCPTTISSMGPAKLGSCLFGRTPLHYSLMCCGQSDEEQTDAGSEGGGSRVKEESHEALSGATQSEASGGPGTAGATMPQDTAQAKSMQMEPHQDEGGSVRGPDWDAGPSGVKRERPDVDTSERGQAPLLLIAHVKGSFG